MLGVMELTELLGKAQMGDRNAWDMVYRVAASRLRSIASQILQQERRGHIYQPTALVGESWIRLFRTTMPFRSRGHFYSFAWRAMSQTLVDASRRHSHRVRLRSVTLDAAADSLSHASLGFGGSSEVRLAFEQLQAWDKLAAETLWLRFAEGFTIEETAALQQRSQAKVREDGDFAREWMADRLR